MEPAGAPGPPAVDTPPDGPPPPLESAQGDPPLSKDDQKVQKQAEKDKKKAIAQEEKARKEEEKKLAADKKKADKERKAATKKWEVAKKQAVRCAAGSPAAILSQCLSPTPEAVCARVFASCALSLCAPARPCLGLGLGSVWQAKEGKPEPTLESFLPGGDAPPTDDHPPGAAGDEPPPLDDLFADEDHLGLPPQDFDEPPPPAGGFDQLGDAAQPEFEGGDGYDDWADGPPTEERIALQRSPSQDLGPPPPMPTTSADPGGAPTQSDAALSKEAKREQKKTDKEVAKARKKWEKAKKQAVRRAGPATAGHTARTPTQPFPLRRLRLLVSLQAKEGVPEPTLQDFLPVGVALPPGEVPPPPPDDGMQALPPQSGGDDTFDFLGIAPPSDNPPPEGVPPLAGAPGTAGNTSSRSRSRSSRRTRGASSSASGGDGAGKGQGGQPDRIERANSLGGGYGYDSEVRVIFEQTGTDNRTDSHYKDD
jgi:hypothetical protein